VIPIVTETLASTPADTGVVARRARRLSGATLREYGIVLVLLVLFVALALSSDAFLTTTNLKNVIDGAVPVGLVACALTIVILAGGFDLSAGAIFAVSAILGVKLSNSVSPVVGIAGGIAVGCGLGLINGLLCTVGRVNHFVGTLGTWIAFGGAATAISAGSLILVKDPSFANLANADVLGFHLSTWIFLATALFFGFLLNRTTFGRQAFGTGGNIAAARLAGISVNRTIATTYVLSGGFAALAGLIVAGRSLSVNADTGSGLIFEAIAAFLIGGNSVHGGVGAIWRTVVGVFILALIANGLNLLGMDPIYQRIVQGTVIVIAVAVDAWTRQRQV
jgi:ribose transport system permease protein